MPLHPQALALLRQMEAAPQPPVASLTPAEARRASREGHALMAGPAEPVASVRDLVVDGPVGPVPVRAYRPDGEGLLPALVYLHGGGFVLGSVDAVDDVARYLANHAGCVVLSVDYHLAPEHRFPVAAEEALAALTWLRERASELGVDAGRLAVGGDSAGANLAAAACLMARDRGLGQPRFQMLVYPVVDMEDADRYPSTAENGKGYILSLEDMEYFHGHYLGSPEDARNPYASPILADSLAGLAPAWIVTAGFDPLRDQGRAYAERLEREGVDVELSAYPDMMHGFLTMAGVLERGRELEEEAARKLRRRLAATAAPSGDAP